MHASARKIFNLFLVEVSFHANVYRSTYIEKKETLPFIHC